MSTSRHKLRQIVGVLSDQLAWGRAALLAARQIDRAGREGAFPTTVYDACVESALLALARLLVAHKDAISVTYLLNCAYHSPSAFPLPEREAVAEAVGRHRALLAEMQPLIDRVKDYRDRTIAHLDKKYVNHRDVVRARPPVALDEVERAFVRLGGVLNDHRRALDLPELDLARLGSDRAGDGTALLNVHEEVQS